MKKPFNTFTRLHVEKIKRKPISGKSVVYAFSKADIEAAIKHLETLYGETVRESFASKILLLNEIY